ncbi:MAG: glutamate dehydrogenase, partial [Acidobacteriota bacterium]
ARIIAVSDSKGGIHNGDGLDPLKVLAHKGKTGSVQGFPGSDDITNEKLLELPCEVLIPAALENQIHLGNVDRIQSKIIAEAANGPTTPGADEILHKNGIFLIPDILANAGGVTVSYFEWVQGLSAFFWEEEEINRRLEKIMKRAFNEVRSAAEKYNVHMRTAAYIVGVNRVAEATRLRGIFP